MDPNLQAQIQALIQQTLQSGQYSVPQTPYHVHNGTDSPKLPLSSTEAGVSSVTASGSGITASPTTGNVVVQNTGVTSIVAGTNITVSGATGAVTVNSTASGGTYANGNFQYNFNNADGSVVVSHGLGSTPANMRVTALYAQGAPSQFLSMGTYNGTQDAVIFSWILTGSGGTSGSATGFALWMRDNAGNGQTAVVTWDAFNLIFTFTKWGTFGSVIFDVMWEANT